MGRQAHAQHLNVWLNGTPVAYWDASAGTSALTYFDAWVEDEAGRPLSLSMPFKPQGGSYRGPLVQNYFDNLLPDSEPIRRRMAQHFQACGIAPGQLRRGRGAGRDRRGARACRCGGGRQVWLAATRLSRGSCRRHPAGHVPPGAAAQGHAGWRSRRRAS